MLLADGDPLVYLLQQISAVEMRQIQPLHVHPIHRANIDSKLSRVAHEYVASAVEAEMMSGRPVGETI